MAIQNPSDVNLVARTSKLILLNWIILRLSSLNGDVVMRTIDRRKMIQWKKELFVDGSVQT